MTDSPLAIVTLLGCITSAPSSPPSFTVTALADQGEHKVSSRLVAPASAKEAAFFCGEAEVTATARVTTRTPAKGEVWTAAIVV